jgi:acetate kinase
LLLKVQNASMAGYVLTINGGSSSVKFALFELGDTLKKKSTGSIKSQNSQDGAERVLEWVKQHGNVRSVAAIGHRIVHGGPKYVEHGRISSEMCG